MLQISVIILYSSRIIWFLCLMRTPGIILIILVSFLLGSCKNETETLFSELGPGKTGIDFRNLLVEDESLNVAHYIYFSNGAGVAIGDINNDGLQDIFFTGNSVKKWR
jgi:enediyne biosynthesis protein E4